jgi:hypothetical protein
MVPNLLDRCSISEHAVIDMFVTGNIILEQRSFLIVLWFGLESGSAFLRQATVLYIQTESTYPIKDFAH